MTREQFAPIMAYLSAGMGGKPMPRETAEVYFDLLGDLQPADLQRAAREALREHKYATFPTVALLRELATGVNPVIERALRCLPKRALTGLPTGAPTTPRSLGLTRPA